MNKPTDLRNKTVTPAPLAEALLAIMNELASIMALETAALEKQDVTAIQETMRQKNRLVMNYQASMKSVAAQPDLLKEMSVERRTMLKDAGSKLAHITERNALALKSAALATDHLLQNVMSLVRKEVAVKPGYSNPRTAHLSLGTHSPVCPPVAVNRTA